MFETPWALVAALLLQQAPPATPPPGGSSPAAVVEKWTDDRPFPRFFQNMAKDFRNLATPNVGIVIGGGAAATAIAHEFDHDLAKWALESGEADYTVVGSVLGNGWTQAGGAVATYTIGKITHRPQVIHIGSDLIRAQALNAVITTTIKAAVDRSRPYGGHHGMPSGHTSATFASATVLHRHYGWKVGIPAYVAAGFVGWTRVRDYVHFLSDVAFGATIGIISGRGVAASHPGRSMNISLAPTKGGAQISFYKVW